MGVEITCLPNGLYVVTHNLPHLETVALGIWVKAGARDERPEENGIAHFLEHMAFKGTERRSAQAIAEEIESAGGEINAATGMETTTYFARVLKNDWSLALDILADIFTGSVLDPEELERERDVILQEIAAAKGGAGRLHTTCCDFCAYRACSAHCRGLWRDISRLFA